jgi:hypothetical protein
MVAETNKRPPRIPLTPEEVKDFIRLKKHKERVKIEKFKQTKTYKVFNAFNVMCIMIYTEIIFAFLGSCNFTTHYVKSVDMYFSDEIKGGKRCYSSVVFKTVNDRIYDVNVHDTCNLPARFSGLNVGKDWLLRKEIKVRFEKGGKDRFIKRSFPLLFISILWGIVTFVLFGYNMNQNNYSLNVITFVNLITMLSFMLL